MRRSNPDYESQSYILHRDIPKYINTTNPFNISYHLNYI